MAALADLITTSNFFITACTILVVWKLVSWWRDPLRRIPGPSGHLILGNSLDYCGDKDLLDLMIERSEKYGKIYKEYHVLTGKVVCTSDPDLVKKVFVSDYSGYTKSTYLKTLCSLFGNGVLTSNGKDHASQRRCLNPYFSTINVQEYIPLFIRKGNQLAEFWSNKLAQNNDLPVETEMMEKFIHLTLDVIGLAAFGYDFDCISSGFSEESDSFNKVLTGSFSIKRKTFEALLPFLKLIPSKQREDEEKAEQVCSNLIRKVIENRKSDTTTKEKINLLERMVELSNKGENLFENKDLLHQVFTFLVGGHDTISTAFTWMLFLFAKYPEAQQKARDEVKQVLGDGQDITPCNISDFVYLGNCISECLRLYPPGEAIGRDCTKEVKIGQYTIPANTRIYISIPSLHNDKEYWKNPGDFNPDRFMEAGKDNPLFPYYYIPFGRGPRMCIGYRFAMMEMKAVLAILLQRFSFKLGNGQSEHVKKRYSFIIKPDPAPMIQISHL